MLAVFKKEFRSSMNGMTGPLFIFAVLAIIGFFTMMYQFNSAMTNFEYSVSDGAFWSLLLTPVLTMRSFAEERKSKTDQLLYSLPITTAQVVLGKFLAMAAVFAIPCAVLCLYPLIITAYSSGDVNFAVIYGSIFAYFLMGCAVIALGMLISSFCESQVICAVLNLAVLLALYFVATLSGAIPDSAVFTLVILAVLSLIVAGISYYATKNYILAAIVGAVLLGATFAVFFIDSSLYAGLGAEIIGAVFIFRPISNFAYGVFDITVFVYYLSLAALFVFITVQSFEKRRRN